MTGDVPTIDQALAAFLAEKQAAVKPRAFQNYVHIVDLLKSSLNGYAYDSLTRFERRRWADEDYVEDYLAIERVEPTTLWFEGGIGPVPVSVAQRSWPSRAGRSTSSWVGGPASGTSSRSATSTPDCPAVG